MRIVTSLLFSVFLYLQLSAQEFKPAYSTPEEGFALMRELAIENRYVTAKQIGSRLLEDNPFYYDVSLYLARIYGWESKYDSAYLILDEVLSQDPSLFEAYETLVDVAYWENDWTKVELYARAAMEINPDSPAIRKKYDLAKYQIGTKQDATELLLFYSYDHFGEPYDRNWHMLTAGGNIPVKIGTISPYLNGGYHAGVDDLSTDFQLNLDSYLTLGKKNYAMAGYGFSPDGMTNYLPGHRAALELWQVLPAGFAISAGIRYFYWERNFTFLTLSAEKYAGNYWFSFRNYLFFKEYGISGSYYLSARRYFADRFNYLNITLGFGTAPDEPLLSVTDLERLGATSVRMEYSRQIRYNLRLSLMAGYAYEEFADQEYRNRIDLRTGLYIRLAK